MLIYSLDANDVFDPFHLDIDVTPESIKNTLDDKDYSKGILRSIYYVPFRFRPWLHENNTKYFSALIMCLKLNEKEIVQQVVESTPPDDSK